MKKVIQNLIAAVSGYLKDLKTANKETLVDAINELSENVCDCPYKIIAGQLMTDSNSEIYFFNGERLNTTGAELVFSKVGVGHYIITADKPIFNQTNTSNFYLPLFPQDGGGQSKEIINPINYIIGYAEYQESLVGTSPYIYHIKTGNPIDGLMDNLISRDFYQGFPPMGYTIKIKIYPLPN